MEFRKLLGVLSAVPLAVGLLLLADAPVTVAHCTTTSGNFYSAGGQTLPAGSFADGVRGDIQWTKGQVCTSGVSHSVTLLPGGGQWLQVGWRYYAGYASPKMYCEGNDPYFIKEYTLTAATHGYKWQYDAADDVWDCYLDSTGKYSISALTMGFTRAGSLNAQGEGHQFHVQVGKMAPDKLLFFDMQYRSTANGNWPAMNVQLWDLDNPYGWDEPAVGRMRVWTNAH